MDTDVIIVGAGHNGIVAATYLARAGLRVALFERRPFVGGAAITEELWPGFHFSTCAHMVHAIHPKILRDLRLRERGLEVLYRAPEILLQPDGNFYGAADHDSPRNLAYAELMTTEESDGLRQFHAFKRTLRSLMSPYRLRTPPALAEVRAQVAGTPAAEVLEQALSQTASQVRGRFLRSDRLRERFASEAASIGRDPLAFSYAYASIDEPEEETGEAPPHGYIRGGMGTLSRILREVAQEAGAELHVGADVARLLVEAAGTSVEGPATGRVIGVRLADGTEVRAPVVISNLDPKQTFLRLLEPRHLDPVFRQRVGELVTEVSCYKLLAAISELPAWSAWDGDPGRPGQGSVVLQATRAHVAAVYDDLEAGRPPRAPVISFSVPSAVDPSLAPPGQHTASAWIFPAPARLREGTWDDVSESVAERLIDQITSYAPNFRASIRNYRLRTPLDLERENGLTDGCIWHVQHTGEQLFWNRPLPELARYRAPLAGLYLCGAGQHPGGEVSGLPGHNAAQEVLRDLDRAK